MGRGSGPGRLAMILPTSECWREKPKATSISWSSHTPPAHLKSLKQHTFAWLGLVVEVTQNRGFNRQTEKKRIHLPKASRKLMGPFPKIGGGSPKWMVKIMENPIKMDDLGGKPYFWKHPVILQNEFPANFCWNLLKGLYKHNSPSAGPLVAACCPRKGLAVRSQATAKHLEVWTFTKEQQIKSGTHKFVNFYDFLFIHPVECIRPWNLYFWSFSKKRLSCPILV